MIDLKIIIEIPYKYKGGIIYLPAGELGNISKKLEALFKTIQRKTVNPIYFTDSRKNPDLTPEHLASLTMPTCWLITFNPTTATEADIAFELFQTELSIDGEENFTVRDERLKILFSGVRSLVRDLYIDEKMKTLDFGAENETSLKDAIKVFHEGLKNVKKIGNLLMAEIALKYYANCIEAQEVAKNMMEYEQINNIMKREFPEALKVANDIDLNLRSQDLSISAGREKAIRQTWDIVFSYLKETQ